MKKLLLLAFALVAISAVAMDTGDCRVQDALSWLAKDRLSIAPEKAVKLTFDWQKGMSFLNRYMIHGFNEADIYEDVIYFNEWEYSTDTHKMTYAQIKGFFVALSALPAIVAHPSTDQLEQKYIEIIHKWKEFDAAQPEYRQAWIKGDWRRIREIMKTADTFNELKCTCFHCFWVR